MPKQHKGHLCPICDLCEACHPPTACKFQHNFERQRKECLKAMYEENGSGWGLQEDYRIINAWARWRWDEEDKAKKRGERSRRRYADDSGSQQSNPEAKPELKPGHYETLGVLRNATVAECVRAARRRLLQVHPDKHPEDRDDPVMKKYWTDEAVKITAAQEILGDAVKKSSYDEDLRFTEG